MDKVQSNIAKKKAIKTGLCYFGLVVLTILLFIPMIFRIAFKESETKKTEDVLSRLICIKTNDTISSTFLNSIPQNIKYTMVGNYMANENTENTDNSETEEQVNPILRKFLNYAIMSYNSESNTSSVSFDVMVTNDTVDYELFFANIDLQEQYFISQGFKCSRE